MRFVQAVHVGGGEHADGYVLGDYRLAFSLAVEDAGCTAESRSAVVGVISETGAVAARGAAAEEVGEDGDAEGGGVVLFGEADGGGGRV